MIQILKIADIRLDGGTQMRDEICPLVAADYAEAYNVRADMPPLVVFWDGDVYWLADGFHRLHGAQMAGFDRIDCDLRPGTRRDAVDFACGANASHGLRRTNAHKRKAVETQLRDDVWVGRSNPEIAQKCCVSEKMVRYIREELEATSEIPKSTHRQGADGRTINTSNIGRSKSAPAKPASESKPAAEDLPGQRQLFSDEGEDSGLFECPECYERFAITVWHCPGCDHHWPLSRDLCSNCHKFEYRPDGTIVYLQFRDEDEESGSGFDPDEPEPFEPIPESEGGVSFRPSVHPIAAPAAPLPSGSGNNGPPVDGGSPAPAAEVVPLKAFHKYLKDFLSFIATVEAPADDVHHGWGGFELLAAAMGVRYRRDLREELRLRIETLNGWIEVINRIEGDSGELDDGDV